MDRKETLRTAEKMVCGHRESDYGSPEDSFARIAKLWSAYMDITFTPHDVSMLMSLLKVARIKNGSAIEGSYVDMCGYAACAAEIAENNAKKAIESACIKEVKNSHYGTGRYDGTIAYLQAMNAYLRAMNVFNATIKVANTPECGIGLTVRRSDIDRIQCSVREILKTCGCISVDQFFSIIGGSDGRYCVNNTRGWLSPGDFHYKVVSDDEVTIVTTAPVEIAKNVRSKEDDTK